MLNRMKSMQKLRMAVATGNIEEIRVLEYGGFVKAGVTEMLENSSDRGEILESILKHTLSNKFAPELTKIARVPVRFEKMIPSIQHHRNSVAMSQDVFLGKIDDRGEMEREKIEDRVNTMLENGSLKGTIYNLDNTDDVIEKLFQHIRGKSTPLLANYFVDRVIESKRNLLNMKEIVKNMDEIKVEYIGALNDDKLSTSKELVSVEDSGEFTRDLSEALGNWEIAIDGSIAEQLIFPARIHIIDLIRTYKSFFERQVSSTIVDKRVQQVDSFMKTIDAEIKTIEGLTQTVNDHVNHHIKATKDTFMLLGLHYADRA